ncbi:DUF4279 domain-containing protein [Nocardia sp. NPDC050406]|uniref:DUF4279 domain-containing protein n=1 Tax=Nocardia sp. NPDC050406 TaxID=3364318 RepID=UPI0037BBCB1A
MPVSQYAYFALMSEHTSAETIAAEVDLAPDEVWVRGSRRTEPRVVPRIHAWKLVCLDSGLRVDEQIERIVDRLRPRTERIATCARRLEAEGGWATLNVVRSFGDPDDRAPTDAPNLFGWHLNREVMEFLLAVGAELDVDEYDLSE